MICFILYFKSPKKDFEVVVEGTRNANRGTIAFDDLDFVAGSCPPFGDNNFENRMSAYDNARNDDFDWVIRKGSTPSRRTGPRSDHTLGNPAGEARNIFSQLHCSAGSF